MFPMGGHVSQKPQEVSVEAMSQDSAKKTARCLSKDQNAPVGKGSSFSGDHIHGPC